jgi:acyl-CoA thioester hydrolase
MRNEFSWSVRVYYEDTDAGGIVFYANYLKFFERARTECLRALGINQLQMTEKYRTIFVVKATSVEYHAPARLDDELRVTVLVKEKSRASITFLQEAWCVDRLLSRAEVKVCCVDLDAWKAVAIPPEVLKLVTMFSLEAG